MYAGAASGAVTIGLALLLIMMSQKPNASEPENKPPPETPAVEKPKADAPVPMAAVVLPPPPAAAPPMAPPVSEAPAAKPPPSIVRPPLKPRLVEAPPKTVEVTPLKPRPAPVPLEAAPTPAPKPAPATEKVPVEQVAKLPDVETPSSPAGESVPAPVTRKTVKEGRALLKMLETGKGPVIEIAWPQTSADRSRLYRLLTSCHGMQTAMLANGSRLYGADTAPGQTWNVNRDAVSGFIRQPAGALTDAEKSVIERIKTRHGILYAKPVRVFPRGVDATMLGGLGEIVGAGYLKYRTIRARYQLAGDRISVIDIRADNEALPGSITLPRTRRCD